MPASAARCISLPLADEWEYDSNFPLPSKSGMKELVLDSKTFRVDFRTQSIFLTRIEFQLFEQLVKSPGGFVDRQELLTRVWGPHVSVEVRTVDSHMVRLRRKLQRLGDQSPTIETVWGLGYRVRMIDDASESSSYSVS
jgi:DNA-binding response OmpR family regulator